MTTTTDASDGELLKRWGAGDREAGSQLLRRHGDALYRFLRYRAVGDVRDIAQQTMLACVETRDRFRGESNFRTYMLQIARYQLYAHYRRVTHATDLDPSTLLATDTSPSGKLARRQRERSLSHALRRLPAGYQAVLQLSFFDELTGPEIAQVLQIPEATVRSRTRRALLRLKEAVDSPAQGCAAPSELELLGWADEVRRSLASVPPQTSNSSSPTGST